MKFRTQDADEKDIEVTLVCCERDLGPGGICSECRRSYVVSVSCYGWEGAVSLVPVEGLKGQLIGHLQTEPATEVWEYEGKHNAVDAGWDVHAADVYWGWNDFDDEARRRILTEPRSRLHVGEEQVDTVRGWAEFVSLSRDAQPVRDESKGTRS